MLQRGEDKWTMDSDRNGQSLPPSRRRQGVAIPIPILGGRKLPDASASSLFSSTDDSSGSSRSTSPTEDFTPLSSSHQGGFHAGSAQNIPLNVYGTSPRTSVMFNYYNSPKGSYARQNNRLIRTKSTDTPHAGWHLSYGNNTASGTGVGCSDINMNRDKTATDGCGLVPPPRHDVPAGISVQHFYQLDDARPRAWSESDKHRTGNMQSSRMSALRRLRMKFGQKGSLKRQKSTDDERNRSGTSIASLEKVEEGCQMSCSSRHQAEKLHTAESDRLSPPTVASSSVHQEHESVKKSERRPKHAGLPQVLENPEAFLVYQRFLEEHTCYDLMPTSSKLVILDTRLEVRKAFHAIIENSLRCAPLWDNEANAYVGMLTVSDFVNILLTYHNCPNKKLEDLENQKISCWRKVLTMGKSLIHLPPKASLFEALKVLTKENIRRLAIVDPIHGDIFHVINHRRILHFLHLFMTELPKPAYMNKSIEELVIGTHRDVAAVSESSPVIDALNLIAKHKISGLPVLDAQGRVTDVFTKTDILVLAEEQLFYDLTIKVKDVISLPTPVSVDEHRPAVVRTMPGSPALTRRRNNPRSTTHHPLIGIANGSKHLPQRLSVENGNVTVPVQKDHRAKDKGSGQYGIVNQGWMANVPLSRGDGFSQRNHQQILHYRNFSTEQLPSPSHTHLVTVKKEDTLEAVINNVVTADVLQAFIVDDHDHINGVISVGDILRFMVYPSKVSHRSTDKADDGSIQLSGEAQRSFTQSAGDVNTSVTQEWLHRPSGLPDNAAQWAAVLDASKPSILQGGESVSKVPNMLRYEAPEDFPEERRLLDEINKTPAVWDSAPTISVMSPYGKQQPRELISLDEAASAEILISGDGMKRH